MNQLEYERKKEVLRESRPIDLSVLSFNEAPHFFGHDIQRAREEDLDYIPIVGEPDLPFHVEVVMYQEDAVSNVCFRHVCARLKGGKIVSFESHGIPDERKEEFRKKCVIVFRIMYPDGLTVEDMRTHL